ncbi:hypothetical protein EDD22DRAFT_856285 [Suillus occidentalis]|nr:hypothetical protein EDD22DRAFT_856285 [Suillus occidentalis]
MTSIAPNDFLFSDIPQHRNNSPYPNPFQPNLNGNDTTFLPGSQFSWCNHGGRGGSPSPFLDSPELRCPAIQLKSTKSGRISSYDDGAELDVDDSDIAKFSGIPPGFKCAIYKPSVHERKHAKPLHQSTYPNTRFWMPTLYETWKKSPEAHCGGDGTFAPYSGLMRKWMEGTCDCDRAVSVMDSYTPGQKKRKVHNMEFDDHNMSKWQKVSGSAEPESDASKSGITGDKSISTLCESEVKKATPSKDITTATSETSEQVQQVNNTQQPQSISHQDGLNHSNDNINMSTHITEDTETPVEGMFATMNPLAKFAGRKCESTAPNPVVTPPNVPAPLSTPALPSNDMPAPPASATVESASVKKFRPGTSKNGRSFWLFSVDMISPLSLPEGLSSAGDIFFFPSEIEQNPTVRGNDEHVGKSNPV